MIAIQETLRRLRRRFALAGVVLTLPAGAALAHTGKPMDHEQMSSVVTYCLAIAEVAGGVALAAALGFRPAPLTARDDAGPCPPVPARTLAAPAPPTRLLCRCS